MPLYTMTILQKGGSMQISASSGETILSALQQAGCTQVHAPCGGRGTCRQCSVLATGRFRSLASPKEFLTAEQTELLACRWCPEGSCTVRLPETETLQKAETGQANIDACGQGLGVAIDIGTTTVAAYLYDLSSGKRLAVDSARNAQRAYGADVISRIQYCSRPEGLDRLRSVIQKQLSESIQKLCAAAHRQPREICRVTLAANTVMEHIFTGLDPSGIGVAPFTPLSLFGESCPAAAYFSGLAENAELFLAPALAGYVGGDITAGLLSSGAWQQEEPCLFLDIGTNGEMGLGSREGFLCCATAAGPAFEGAEIECGMSGTAGAISKVSYVNQNIALSVIGDREAAGICGSGLIDALCVMLRCGAVDETGRLLSSEEAPENIRSRIRESEKGELRFYLTDRVYVSAGDIRQLQLAKAAIRAGVETLLETRKLSCDQISRVYLAGGFGAFLDVKSACAIGLLPPALLERTGHIGNAAGLGAAMALDPRQRQVLTKLSAKCDYLELSSSALFMDKYIEMMFFDEVEEVFAND